jgi:hypothetical protein
LPLVPARKSLPFVPAIVGMTASWVFDDRRGRGFVIGTVDL